MPTDEVTIVLIHGAGTGAWAWERVQARLPIPSLAVDMPLGEEGATPHRCADIVMAALSDSQTSRLIPVLHSWAGVLRCRSAKFPPFCSPCSPPDEFVMSE